jgi:hypothetical protein
MRLLRLGAGEAATITQQPGSGGPWIQRRLTAELSGPFSQCKDQCNSNGQYNEKAGAMFEDCDEAGERKGKILYGSPHGTVAFERKVWRMNVLHGLLQVDNLISDIPGA